MIIYADILFINNTLMTFAIIWTVGQLLELKYCCWTLIISSMIGTIYTFLFILIRVEGWPLILKLLWYIGLNVLTALLMINIASYHSSRKMKFKALIYLYAISFITIGMIISIFNIYDIRASNISNKYFFIPLALIFLFFISRFGWHYYKEHVKGEELYLPVKIFINDKKIELIGLLDTGNRLNDPITKVPVLIIEWNDILNLFAIDIKEDIKEKINANKSELIELINIFNDLGWGNRIRILPFADLGQEHGILLAFRPDKIIIEYKDNFIESERVIIALTEYTLDEEDNYHALIHPRLLRN